MPILWFCSDRVQSSLSQPTSRTPYCKASTQGRLVANLTQSQVMRVSILRHALEWNQKRQCLEWRSNSESLQSRRKLFHGSGYDWRIFPRTRKPGPAKWTTCCLFRQFSYISLIRCMKCFDRVLNVLTIFTVVFYVHTWATTPCLPRLWRYVFCNMNILDFKNGWYNWNFRRAANRSAPR